MVYGDLSQLGVFQVVGIFLIQLPLTFIYLFIYFWERPVDFIIAPCGERNHRHSREETLIENKCLMHTYELQQPPP